MKGHGHLHALTPSLYFTSNTSLCYTCLQLDLLETCWLFSNDVAAHCVDQFELGKAFCTLVRHCVIGCGSNSILEMESSQICCGRVLRFRRRVPSFMWIVLWALFLLVYFAPLLAVSFYTRQAIEGICCILAFRKIVTNIVVGSPGFFCENRLGNGPSSTLCWQMVCLHESCRK